MRREQEAIDTGIRVEGLDYRMTLVGVSGAVETHVRDRGHVLLEQVRLDDIEHLLHLAEDEHTVLRERPCRSLLGIHELRLRRIASGPGCESYTAVDKELAVGIAPSAWNLT